VSRLLLVVWSRYENLPHKLLQSQGQLGGQLLATPANRLQYRCQHSYIFVLLALAFCCWFHE
jgi:hypothetical protein